MRWKEVPDKGSSQRVLEGDQVACGFIQNHVNELVLFPDFSSIDRDHILLWIDLVTQIEDRLAIDLDPSFSDESICLPSGDHTRLGEKLVQPGFHPFFRGPQSKMVIEATVEVHSAKVPAQAGDFHSKVDILEFSEKADFPQGQLSADADVERKVALFANLFNAG